MELKGNQFSREMEDIAGKVDLKLKDSEKTIAVVSVDKGTPKEILTANLAVNWSRYLKILVLDLNFGKMPFDSVFNNSNESKGISEFLLSKNLNLPEVEKTQFTNLFFVPAGEIVDNANLRLQSKRFTGMIDYFKGEFDRIIINGMSSDSLNEQLIPLKIGDTSIIVVSKKFSKKRRIAKMSAAIQDIDAQCLGAVYVY